MYGGKQYDEITKFFQYQKLVMDAHLLCSWEIRANASRSNFTASHDQIYSESTVSRVILKRAVLKPALPKEINN